MLVINILNLSILYSYCQLSFYTCLLCRIGMWN